MCRQNSYILFSAHRACSQIFFTQSPLLVQRPRNFPSKTANHGARRAVFNIRPSMTIYYYERVYALLRVISASRFTIYRLSLSLSLSIYLSISLRVVLRHSRAPFRFTFRHCRCPWRNRAAAYTREPFNYAFI